MIASIGLTGVRSGRSSRYGNPLDVCSVDIMDFSMNYRRTTETPDATNPTLHYGPSSQGENEQCRNSMGMLDMSIISGESVDE